jgi:hypothetical protein
MYFLIRKLEAWTTPSLRSPQGCGIMMQRYSLFAQLILAGSTVISLN